MALIIYLAGVLVEFWRFLKLYNPQKDENFNANITLFKAVAPTGIYKDQKIFDYYAKNTDYNHLDDYVPCNSINIIKLESDHNSWIMNAIDLETVSSRLIDLSSRKTETNAYML